MTVVAVLMLMLHAAVPHHHHGNLICFNPRCVEFCECHHDHEAVEAECGCSHHHHDADECSLFAPYILNDNVRNISQTLAFQQNVLDCVTDALSSGEIEMPALAELYSLETGESSPPEVQVFDIRGIGLRAPPAA